MAEPASPQPTPPKPGRRRRWLWILGSILVALLLLVLLGPTIASTGPVRSMVLSSINGSLNGNKLEIDDWSLGWTTGISATGIRLKDQTGNSMIELPQLTTELTLLKALGGNYALGHVPIHGLVVHIVKRADGTTNLSTLSSSRKKSSTTIAIPNLSGEIDLADCHGDVTDAATNHTAQIPSITGDIKLDLHEQGDSQAHLTLAAAPFLTVTGDVSGPSDAFVKSINLLIAGLAALDPTQSSTEVIPAPGGTASAAVTLHIDLTQLATQLPDAGIPAGAIDASVTLKALPDKAQLLINAKATPISITSNDKQTTIEGFSADYALNIAGNAAVDPRGNGLIKIDKLTYPGLTVTGFQFYPHLISHTLVNEIPGKPAGQNWPTPATCNNGTLDLGGATVSFIDGQPRLTLPPGKHMLNGISLNPLLAPHLTSILGPLFADPSQATGSLDLTADKCDRLPLGALLQSTDASNDGTADFTLNIAQLQIAGGPILGGLATVGIPTIGGEIRNGHIHIERGMTTTDIPISLGQRGQTIGFKGGIRMSDLALNNFVMAIGGGLLHQLGGSSQEIDVPITGTASSPQLDIGRAVSGVLLNGGGQKDLLNNFLQGVGKKTH